MKYLIVFLLLLNTLTAVAQEKSIAQKISMPTPVELNIGNSRFGLQFIINKQFSATSKFNFFTVTTFQSDYDNNTNNLDFITNSQVGYELFKGFSAVTGLSVNSKSGLSPTTGLKYVFANRQVLFVITPTLELSSSKSIQGLALLEYKPKLTKKIDLYSRIQGMYKHDTKNDIHQRSYMQLRLGMGIQKYQFGLASNWDYYGPAKILKDNFGVFIKVNFP